METTTTTDWIAKIRAELERIKIGVHYEAHAVEDQPDWLVMSDGRTLTPVEHLASLWHALAQLPADVDTVVDPDYEGDYFSPMLSDAWSAIAQVIEQHAVHDPWEYLLWYRGHGYTYIFH